MEVISLLFMTADHQIMAFPPYRTSTADPGQARTLFSLAYFTDKSIVYSSARCNISGRKSF